MTASTFRIPFALQCLTGAGLWLALGTLLQTLEAAPTGPGAEPDPTSLSTSQETEEARFFVLSESCARCHTAVPTAEALWSESGEDASPIGTWSASVMANSFKDPYWRAQLERELSLAPSETREELRNECTKCHAPAAIHEALLGGESPPDMQDLMKDPAAHEGVTCTVCHRATAEGLGTEATFNGNIPMDLAANLYGPFPEPEDGPMAAMSGYQVKFGAHMVASSLCATCHTLETGHGSKKFLEQSPYLEWRNSIYSYEDGVTESSKSCQECHMTDMGSMALAHNPAGGDFGFLGKREEVRSHAIVGGNAFLLDMLAIGKEELGVQASTDALANMAQETRTQLAQVTANVEIFDIQWTQENLNFGVQIENLTGHKLPCGYPSRRAWVEVQVRSGNQIWFASGVPDKNGRITPSGKAFAAPHYSVIRSPEQVQIYEMVALDESGQQTTHLSAMTDIQKDNRLLPLGWTATGPHGAETAPRGLGDDSDFVGGGDRLWFELEIPEEIRSAGGRPRITARLLYQSIPPGWADDHRGSEGPFAKQFVSLYDKVETRYEVLGSAQRMAR